MSSQGAPNEGFNWAEAAPNHEVPEEVARQIRLMRAAGKKPAQIGQWLEQNGFTEAEAEAIVAAFQEPVSWRRRCTWIGTAVGALVSLIVVILALIFTPWGEIPTKLAFYCYIGLVAFTVACGVLSGIVGDIIDRIRNRLLD